MKNYIPVVLGKINNKNHRKLISKELQTHIDDRVEYYIGAGYDEETARTKANDDMGEDAETVGQQLNFIHQNYSFLNIVFVIVNTVLFFFVLVFVLAGIEENSDIAPQLTGYSHFYILSVFIIAILVELYLALKLKLMFIAEYSLVNFFCYAFVTRGYVPTMFALYKLLKGELQGFANFTAF